MNFLSEKFFFLINFFKIVYWKTFFISITCVVNNYCKINVKSISQPYFFFLLRSLTLKKHRDNNNDQ